MTMRVESRKRTLDSPIRAIAPPARVRLETTGMSPLRMPGDAVEAGELVGRSPAGARFELRRHASIAGRVVSAGEEGIVIEGEPGPVRPMTPRPATIEEAAREAGLVGMGGAMFPTYVKLAPAGASVECVIVNGSQSEPYVTCDSRVLAEFGDEVESGADLAMRALGARRRVIVAEPDRYPGGDERLLIHRLLGREVPFLRLPRDVGAVVFNVQTARALAAAWNDRRPLVDRVLTVDGGAVARPGNYVVPIGTEIGHVLSACGADLSRAAAIVRGGPMMGEEVDVRASVLPGTVAVLALTRDDLSEPLDEPCIRCGDCHTACPYDLPAALLIERPTVDVLRCVGCGMCEWACPSRRPLVARLALAKAAVRARRAAP
jgi:electron transport complex protein RnfC